ncbi:MAG: T9SS type A sorting domain-containing protein [Bacteroidetes bacterium]|nr:T9SS type A sorting domain-containing protein [Bacteroidota bacterium]
MKKYFSILLICAVVAAMYWFNRTKVVDAHAVDGFSSPWSKKTGRKAYELERLVDPATGKIPAGIRAKELAYAATLPNDLMAASFKSMSSASWINRGPYNVGGRTRAFAVDASNSSVLLAGSAAGGLWRSTNAGQNWNCVSDKSKNMAITCIAQDKRIGKTNVWYSGTGEAYGASPSGGGAYYLGNGIYKSIDGGVSWNLLSATSPNSPQSFNNYGELVWNVATNPADLTNDAVFAACVAGIYKSLDGGTTWTQTKGTSLSIGYSYFTDVQVTSTGVIYATLSSDGGQKGIWRSANNGANWTNITPSNFPSVYDRIVIGISPADENQVWFLAHTPGFGAPDTNYLGDVEWNSLWKYKYLSGTGAASGGLWNNYSQNLPSSFGVGPFDQFSAQGGYDLVVKVKPNDTNVVFIGGTNVYRSTNGFQDKTQIAYIGGYKPATNLPIVESYINHHPDQHVLEFLPGNPNVLYSAHDGGISVTQNCMASTVVWSSLSNSYITSMFYTVAIDHAMPNNPIVIGGLQDNGTQYTNSTNPQTLWTQSRGADGSYCAIADSQKMYYMSIQNGKMMKGTLNSNGNFQNFARIDPIGGKNYLFINPYTLDPNNNNIMYLAGGKNVWRNHDLSQIPLLNTWDSVQTNWTMFPDTVAGNNVRVSAITACKVPANRVYYGTTNRKVFRLDSANAGTPIPKDITGTAVNGALFPTGNVSCIAVDPRDGNKVMVAFSNYNVYSVFYSDNGGTTWTKAAGNLEQNVNGTGNGPSVRWLSIMPVGNKTVYWAATSTGLYATDTLMGTSTVWVQQATNEIGNMVCTMIDYRESDGLVVVATHAQGVFSANITSVNDIYTAVDYQKQAHSNEFSVAVFPNPTDGLCSVFVQDINTISEIEVSVFALDGKRVSYSKRKNTDTHFAIDIDLRAFPAGIYNLQVSDGNKRNTTKKIVKK